MSVFKCKALVTRTTDTAIKADLTWCADGADTGWQWSGCWVPRSVLHEDNEVNERMDSGTLAVAMWWAVKKGLVPYFRRPPGRSLAVQESVHGIVQAIEGAADVLDSRTVYDDALCECGACGSDPIGYHAAKLFRDLAQLVQEWATTT